MSGASDRRQNNDPRLFEPAPESEIGARQAAKRNDAQALYGRTAAEGSSL